MKKIIIVALAIYAVLMTVSCSSLIKVKKDLILKNERLTLENQKLSSMCGDVLDYIDSTADTGEMDEFIESFSGQHFFELYQDVNIK